MPAETATKPPRGMPVWPASPPELQFVPLPERLLIPLSAHGIGEPKAKPPGTPVHAGDSLVDHAAESSHVPVAPVDGVLGETRPVRLTTGKPATAVELIVSGTIPAEQNSSPPDSKDVPSLVAWLEQIRAAGVCADRHASPDLIGQLNHLIARPIDTIICTMLDSDASLRLNATLAARFAERICQGIAMMSKVTGARRTIAAVEFYAGPAWVEPVRHAAESTRIKIVELTNDYPQSDPTLMIYTLANRRLQPGVLPTTQGILVLDAAAALAIGNVGRMWPMLTTPIAVHDHQRRQSHYLQAAVGTPLTHVLKMLGIEDDANIVRGGDLLRDVRIRPDSILAGGELAIHVTGPEQEIIPEPCIRCAWCIEACPTLLHPAAILDAAQRRDMKMAERAGISACIECGLCFHVCPSRLPLLEAVREIRYEMRKTSC